MNEFELDAYRVFYDDLNMTRDEVIKLRDDYKSLVGRRVYLKGTERTTKVTGIVMDLEPTRKGKKIEYVYKVKFPGSSSPTKVKAKGVQFI